MSQFNDFTESVKEGAKELAREVFGDFEHEAKEDVEAFLERSKEDLQRWTKLLAHGELSQQEFRDLVEAKKSLAEIHLLTQQGVALTKLERFKNGLTDLVVDSAFDAFL